MKELTKKSLWILFGTFLIAIAMHLFFVPSHIAAGGLSGFAIVVNYLLPGVPIGTILLVGNVILFLLGFLILGKQFGLLTLFGSLSLSVIMMILERFFPITQPIVEDVLLVTLLGGSLCGLGLSFVFTQNASTGGTDILGTILTNLTHINLSKTLLLVDAVVVLLGAIFISFQSALYAIVALYIQSLMLDNMMTGLQRRIVMHITTSHVEEINTYIITQLHRGTSIYPITGGFSRKPQEVIVTVVHHREYVRLKDYVEKVDPRAFVYVYSANEVLGEGFTYAPGALLSENAEIKPSAGDITAESVSVEATK